MDAVVGADLGAGVAAPDSGVATEKLPDRGQGVVAEVGAENARERFNLRSVCAWDDTPSAEPGTEFASDGPRIEISAIE